MEERVPGSWLTGPQGQPLGVQSRVKKGGERVVKGSVAYCLSSCSLCLAVLKLSFEDTQP